MKVVGLVLMYLSAIVAANVLFAQFGMVAEPWLSLVLIGLDLTSRDNLHQAWGGRWLPYRMSALILSGSALSAVMGFLTGTDMASAVPGGIVQVSLASGGAFAAAASVDALTYGVLKQRWLRVNGSNLVSGLVDSFVFPFIVFNEFKPELVIYFALVKFVGGALWWLALGGWRDVREALGQHAVTESH